MGDLNRNQSHVIDFLKKSYSEDKLVHAYLFFGGNKDMKINVAKQFATLLLGQTQAAKHLIEMNEHANVIMIKPDGKNIKKEQIVFLKTEIAKKSVENHSKIYIIEDADKMSISATNSLLKFLEEPAPEVYIILISPSKEALLPTITSRTVNLGFKALPQGSNSFKQEILDVIKQLEEGASPQVVVAKNTDFFKEEIMDFLDAYQAYYREEMNKLFSTQISATGDIKRCVKRVRAIEEAKRSLQYNMNVQLCLDKLWIDFS